MIAIGAFVAARLMLGLSPLTRSLVLDVTFAGFFILRGVMNIRLGRRVSLREAPHTTDT